MESANTSARGCGCLLAALGWVLGGVILLAGLAWGYRSFTVQENWTASRGVVIDLQRDPDSASDAFAPVVVYETVEGVEREFTHTVYSDVWDVGDPVDVRYDPDEPDHAVVYSDTGFWLGPVVFGTIGLSILIVTTLASALVNRRARRRSARPPVAIPSGPRRPAEFRRVETDIDGTGTFRWRIVAKGEDGREYRSDWMNEDPQMDLMNNRYQVTLVQRGHDWVVIQSS